MNKIVDSENRLENTQTLTKYIRLQNSYFLHILCVYDLFHVSLSFWQTFGSMKCVHVCVYTASVGHIVYADRLD
jgi:hypothetical protein